MDIAAGGTGTEARSAVDIFEAATGQWGPSEILWRIGQAVVPAQARLAHATLESLSHTPSHACYLSIDIQRPVTGRCSTKEHHQ